MISIDNEKCNSCEQCLDVCPARIYMWDTPDEEFKKIIVDNEDLCIYCGHCIAICPENAIVHEKLPLKLFHSLEPLNITPESLENLLLSRRSVRTYKMEVFHQAVIEKLLEVAIHAGTASNTQDIGYVVIQKKETLLELEALVTEILWKQLKRIGNPVLRGLARLYYGNIQVQRFYRYYLAMKKALGSGDVQNFFFRDAPAAIILHSPKKDSFGAVNCALAIANMTIMAQSLKVGVCWVGFLIEAANRSHRINKYLNIPKSQKIHGCLIMGYPKYCYEKSVPRQQPKINWL
ncbi:MAG: nitroreductase family protein [Promethearchaeota archaeon]